MKYNLLIWIFMFTITSTFAGNIQYGYNAQGDYVPTSINGNQVQYGYNAQ